CLATGTYRGIEHTRCWIADLLPLYLDRSHNHFNKRMFQHLGYTQSIGNPFNNMAIRSPRLCGKAALLDELAEVASACFHDAWAAAGATLGKVSGEDLCRRLLLLRRDAAIKLQKLNPLYLVIESVARSLGLTTAYGGQPSFLADLSETT